MSYKTRNIIGMLIYFLMLACGLLSYKMNERSQPVLAIIFLVVALACIPVLFKLGRK